MNLLGIIVEPKKCTFIIISYNDSYEVLNKEEIKVPLSLTFPEQLKYIRNCILDILREYEIEFAGIRLTEGISQNVDLTRVQIEGVIQESFSSSNLKSYFTGRKNSISSKLNISMDDFKEYVNGTKEYPIGNWNVLSNKMQREAALVSVGALAC